MQVIRKQRGRSGFQRISMPAKAGTEFNSPEQSPQPIKKRMTRKYTKRHTRALQSLNVSSNQLRNTAAASSRLDEVFSERIRMFLPQAASNLRKSSLMNAACQKP